MKMSTGGSSDDTFVFDDNWGKYTITSGGTIDEDILDFSAVSNRSHHHITARLIADGTVSSRMTAILSRDEHPRRLGRYREHQGRSGTNTFVFEDQGGLEGYIEGAGTNILDYSAYTTAIYLDLSTMDVVYSGTVDGATVTSSGAGYATGVKGVNNISRVVGGSRPQGTSSRARQWTTLDH